MSFFEHALALQENVTPFVSVTLVSVRGSAPQNPGAKALIGLEGLLFGTVGGGKVEARAIQKALELLKENAPRSPELLTWNLQKDIGMTCGGEATFLFELFLPSAWEVVIFGAGHVSQALTRTLSSLHCKVTCLDPRPEWIEKLPKKTHAICHPDPSELIVTLNPNSFFISMTQGHASDVPILKALSEHAPDAPYIGAIGSRTKGERIKTELLEMGVRPEFIEKLKIPIGLSIGTNEPAEISISIAAEILQVRDLIHAKAVLLPNSNGNKFSE